MKNIYLTGFMGAGKSTLAKLVAAALQRAHSDTDDMITSIISQSTQSISTLFKEHGEDAFRQQESSVIATLAKYNNLVVSVGGGAVLAEKNRQAFAQGHWIYLDVPLDTLITRCALTTDRPLATSRAALIALFQSREPLYQLAPLHIACGDHSPEFLCQKILNTIK